MAPGMADSASTELRHTMWPFCSSSMRGRKALVVCGQAGRSAWGSHILLVQPPRRPRLWALAGARAPAPVSLPASHPAPRLPGGGAALTQNWPKVLMCWDLRRASSSLSIRLFPWTTAALFTRMVMSPTCGGEGTAGPSGRPAPVAYPCRGGPVALGSHGASRSIGLDA